VKPVPAEDERPERHENGVLARCQACRKAHEGEAFELDGIVWEHHFPMRCEQCGEPNELIATVPIAAAVSHDGDEWYVIVLDDEALARIDLRRDPWPADEEPN
jgi:hypothetical protein